MNKYITYQFLWFMIIALSFLIFIPTDRNLLSKRLTMKTSPLGKKNYISFIHTNNKETFACLRSFLVYTTALNSALKSNNLKYNIIYFRDSIFP